MMASARVLVFLAACAGQASGVLFSDGPQPRAPRHMQWPKTWKPKPTDPPAPAEACTEKELGAKDIDLLMYGVTGYTGRLAAFYLANRTGKATSWAIAGRSHQSLEWIRSLVSKNTSSPPKEALNLDLRNATRAVELARRARVVVSFAGPYEPNQGEALIQAALKGCAHYVDISTELQWRVLMLDKYKETAKMRGVALVQSAGFASLASDLLAMSAIQDAVEAQGAAPTNVMVVWTKLNDAVSGGLLATSRFEFSHHVKNFNPYILAPEVPDERKVDWTVDGMDDYGFKKGVGIMNQDLAARKDCPFIRRSIMAQFPTTPVAVRQSLVGNNLTYQRQKFLTRTVDLKVDANPPTDPLPGEGPPYWVRAKGSFAGWAVAKGTWGDKSRKSPGVRVRMEGKQDPLFMGSARMATEVALSLAWNGPKDNKGGYLTPTMALGVRALEKALQETGGGKVFSFTHESLR